MIKYTIIALIVIITLSYFGYDIKSIVEAPTTQHNLTYAWGGVSYVWQHWLKAPATYVWNNIIVGILWKAFIHNMSRIDGNAPTEIEAAGQRMINTGNQPYKPIGQ